MTGDLGAAKHLSVSQALVVAVVDLLSIRKRNTSKTWRAQQITVADDGCQRHITGPWQAVEGANGELGFYLVSDGTGLPYKARCRPPSFVNMGCIHLMLLGSQVADIVPVFGQINMIGGECDR